MFSCEKANNYVELYKLSAPAGLVFKTCLENGCITNDNGFARFIPTTPIISPPTIITQQTPTPAPVASLTPAPVSIYKGIASLSASCTCNSATATIKSDVTSGTCRTIVFSTSNGDIQIQGCEKSGNYVEVYRQSYPNNVAFKACMGTGCVDNYGGFTKFQPSVSSITSTATISTQLFSTSTPIVPQFPISTTPITYDISTLPITIQPSGTLVTDIMDGQTCRKVQYNTQYGWDEAKICAKDTTYEMYLLSSPNAASICVGNNCVGQNSGFASFKY
jgi:hypothetical protein